MILTARALRDLGVGERAQSRLVEAGQLLRIRRDRYCPPDTDPAVMEAVRIGGVLSCVSALRHHGLWVTERAGLHVHLPPNSSRLRRGNAVRHWAELREPPDLESIGVLDALLVSIGCQPRPDAIASIDSALNRGAVRAAALRSAGVALLDACDGRAESGLESLTRVALRDAGLRVESQVPISGVGRVDLLVEGCVIVETDGAEFHSGPRRHADYQRDGGATALGYTALRFDTAQVLQERPVLVDATIAAVRTHRRAGFSGRDALRARNRVESRR